MADTGLPGSPKTGVPDPGEGAEGERLGRADGHLHPPHGPATRFSRTTLTMSRSPTLTPPLVTTASQVPAAPSSTEPTAVLVVTDDAQVHRAPIPRGRTRARRTWRLASRICPGANGPGPGDQLVTGRQNPDPRPGVDDDLGHPLVGQHAEVARGEHRPRPGHHVAEATSSPTRRTASPSGTG